MPKKLVTSALPYSYAIPHLGNFVGSVLPADVYFKYLKMKGEDAIFICGSDQHGTAIELQALKEKVDPKELSDSFHEKIKGLFEGMGCTFTLYGKTHTEQNREVVYELFKALKANGYITEIESIQAYCNVDKHFLADRFIEGECPFCHGLKARGDQCDTCGRLLEPDQIINPHCTICGSTDIAFKKTKNLAISLDKLQGKIKGFIEGASGNNWSKNAINESLGNIKNGLKPRDITRNMKWGFQVNEKGFEDLVFYVWFDAVIGYMGITKEWDSAKWQEYWKGKDTELIQFMGKDNIEFHTIIFPGILIGADLGYVLPHSVKAYEYLTSKSVKFSKSSKVGLNLENALAIMPSDYWRFSLMYMCPENADSEFSIDLLKEIVDKIMNDKIGNLVNRVVTLYKNNTGALSGKVSNDPRSAQALKEDIRSEIEKRVKGYDEGFGSLNMRDAIYAVVELATLGNTMLNEREPWSLAKAMKSDAAKKEEFVQVMNSLVQIVYSIGILVHPFAPNASSNILSYFSISDPPSADMLDRDITVATDREIKPIFQKMTEDQLAALGKFSTPS